MRVRVWLALIVVLVTWAYAFTYAVESTTPWAYVIWFFVTCGCAGAAIKLLEKETP